MTIPALVGMVHLPPLPGRPNHGGDSLDDVIAGALADARALEDAGFDGILLQNSLDRPTRERVDAATIAQLTRIGVHLAGAVGLSLGVNVHKNDGPAAIAIAAASGASFVRVKVHTGLVLSAEGLVEGCAEETLALRARLGSRVAIWADVHDPTSRPLPGDSLAAAARDAADFGSADALVITRPTVDDTIDTISDLRSRLPDTPMVVGGGVDHGSVRRALEGADGVIVGSALKETPGIEGRIQPELASELVTASGRSS